MASAIQSRMGHESGPSLLLELTLSRDELEDKVHSQAVALDQLTKQIAEAEREIREREKTRMEEFNKADETARTISKQMAGLAQEQSQLIKDVSQQPSPFPTQVPLCLELHVIGDMPIMFFLGC
jgi:seryl-tRNA synthetase